jgi:hypothetical protein
MLRRAALVRTDFLEELSASIIKVTRIGELQEPHGITFQKMPFFIVTAVKTSNLTRHLMSVPRSSAFKVAVADITS